MTKSTKAPPNNISCNISDSRKRALRTYADRNHTTVGLMTAGLINVAIGDELDAIEAELEALDAQFEARKALYS